MKAAPFEYSRPASVEEACTLLAADDSARAIAGGQTLVPMMAMRLARPTRLVDIHRITDLSYIRDEGDRIALGAVTRQCVIERDALIPARLPLLARALPNIGHTATRARGTIGGSLAHADPAAELALVALTLDATIVYKSAGGDGAIAARDFFVGPTITNLPAGAVLSAVHMPVWSGGRIGVAFHEVNARSSDFAFVSAAAQIELAQDGTATRIALGIGAITDTPIRLHSAETQLTGTTLDPAAVTDAVRAALESIETTSDLHASAAYRRRVAATLAVRAIADALADAKGTAKGKPHAH